MPTYSPCISIHSPYTGRDKPCNTKYNTKNNFNPLSLYRERRYFPLNHINLKGISIHSPYTGRDCTLLGLDAGSLVFQSTLPIQGETFFVLYFVLHGFISIHSPYTGRDSTWLCPVRNEYISIHSPYTGRDGTARSIHPCKPAFQSTLPIQGETRCIRDQFLCDGISIHSPYTGRDEPKEHTTSMWWYFNPLSLYRERLYPVWLEDSFKHFNPLSLYRERRTEGRSSRSRKYFNPLSLYRERRRRTDVQDLW